MQGALGVVIANLDLIMGWCVLDPSMRGLVAALVMAVLSPIWIGNTYLDNSGRDSPASLNSTGDMQPSVEWTLKLSYRRT